MRITFWWLSVVGILLCAFQSAAFTPLNIDVTKGKVNLAAHFEYNIGQSDPLEAPPIEGWSQLPSDYIKLGFVDNVQWFRTSLINNNPHPLAMFVEIDNPLLDNVTLYILSEGKVRSVQNLGDNYEFKLRPVVSETFIVPVSFLPNETLELYLAVQSAGSVEFAANLWHKEAFQQQQNFQRLRTGIFIGIIIAAIFAYLVVYIFEKKANSLLDAGLLLSLLMIVLTMNGVAFHYIWPDFPVMQQHAFYVFSCLAIICSALLAKHHIAHLPNVKKLNIAFDITAGIAFILLPLSLYLSYQWGIYLITSAAALICLVHIYSGIWVHQHGLEEEQDLNVSVVILLASIVFIAINNYTSTNLPISNLAMLQVAMLLIVAVFSVSMIRQHIHQKQRLEEMLEFSDVTPAALDDTDELQAQLAEQNLELQFTLRELEERNQELEKINTLDALSGIHNRRHFDKRIAAELKRSRRELSPLTLIMFDIDHFKKVNDNYGHVAGDEVIRVIAQMGKDQLNRPADEIFRYGGEEFAVLLPNTELSGAQQIAESIRSAIEDATSKTPAGDVQVTVSLGVACTGNEHQMEPADLIEKADSALYKAKSDGRNCIRVAQQTDNSDTHSEES